MLTEFKMIDSACADDAHRPQLNGVYFDGPKGRMIATNGHIMAIVPLNAEEMTEEEKGKTALIPSEAFKEWRREQKKQKRAEVPLVLNGKAKLPNGMEFPYIEERTPNYDAVMPDPDMPVIVKIGINAELLSSLATAMGAKTLELHIRSSEKAVEVFAVGNECHGLIMPFHLKDPH